MPILPAFSRDIFAREDVNSKPPLRAELYSADEMELHARQIAARHELGNQFAPELLLPKLNENEDLLSKVANILHLAVNEKRTISPAAEWLLDNFYLIEEQILTAKRHLPKGYSKGLPKLKDGLHSGFPRVYDIAIEIISHSDGHVDIYNLSNFIQSYQKIDFLQLGELWALPIMLRISLIENLRRVAARIALDRIDTDLAHHWANLLIQTAEKKPRNLVLVIADMAKENLEMSSSFIAEFTRKLQWKGPELALPLSWIEQHLSETGTTINSLVLQENQQQAADQVSVSNSINSLRFLAKTDWREFVEATSIVEKTLNSEASGFYPEMDFYTRDHYRHSIEKLSRRSLRSENEIAEIVKELADKNTDPDPRKSHVGFYLIDEGFKTTQSILHAKRSFYRGWIHAASKRRGIIYFTAAFILTLVISSLLLIIADLEGGGKPLLITIGFLGIFCASHFALSLVNWITSLLVGPEPLPRMDFAKEIPASARTLVIVPTLITGTEQAAELLRDLEVRFLSSREQHLHFGLLTDLKDADEQIKEGELELINLVKNGVMELNLRYGSETNDLFFLFHRPRQWNVHEKKWMGYERKRGKLTELNRLLRGKNRERFSVVIGNEVIFHEIRFVITLDGDTLLPREVAWKLVGVLSHPLNKAIYDEQKGRVVKGYGIIQPRVAVSLHGSRSLYSRIHENDSGIDPYTRITSDLYQDVFKEGSFIGKGIYDVDAFEAAISDRFPENRILSHDLLEGSYARSGFASDVQFYEEYPSKYSSDILRRHRWVRGDWQIAAWALPWAPQADGKWRKNPLSLLSRWKIFDNLRRSLVAPALVLLLVLGWMIPNPWFWTSFITAILIFPPLIISAWNILGRQADITRRQHIISSIRNTYRSVLQAIFTIICLPYEAWINTDAIIKTLWRILFSHKNLLEWNPSGFNGNQKETLVGTALRMWIAPVASIGMGAWLFIFSLPAFFTALPYLLLWILSPAVVWVMSQPLKTSRSKLSDPQYIYLRQLARKTWTFFDHLVGSQDNWLPPDNLQEYPTYVIAHRTSPTNIGVGLLANLTAFDFGYIPVSVLLERTGKTIESMDKLERFSGHFYNWYNTETLETLHPRYVSTVDSGNLAGHLLTLRQGLLALKDCPVIGLQIFDGLKDCLGVIRTKFPETTNKQLDDFINKVSEIRNRSSQIPQQLLEELEALSSEFKAFINSCNVFIDQNDSEWVADFLGQIDSINSEIRLLLPWFKIPERFKDLTHFTGIPTLARIAGLEADPLSAGFQHDDFTKEENEWFALVKVASEAARERLAVIDELCEKCREFADLDFNFLYDPTNRLLSIGYNVDEYKRDAGYYDLLASEARLAIFLAIAQDKIPQESWFALGRRLTMVGNTPVLLSWSGSMFEYLMPDLVMPTYENTLIEETGRAAVRKQIEYGKLHNIPWGVSESCYNNVDASLNYQYRAFGIPGIGFKRGLGLDLVIAPYATVMALMVDPEAAYQNLERMRKKGFEGRYGFYEAIDYTPSRLPQGKDFAVIQTYMAHHQGMSFLALSYLLLDQPNQKRFEADQNLQTALLLLQEQVPKPTGFYSAVTETDEIITISSGDGMRVITTPNTASPEIQLLSNGNYHVMVTAAGSGYSRWKGLAVTRWKEDPTMDNRGTFCYIRDLNSGEFWSPSYHPTLKKPTNYTAIFSQGRVEFRRTDDGIELHTEIVVSPEDDIEIRRIRITNQSRSSRNIDITSYAEVVLASQASDDAHATFSNLFVQTEIHEHLQAILCTRRPRSADEKPPWMLHLMQVSRSQDVEMSFETNRLSFVGRGRSLVNPLVMENGGRLSGSQGAVLDPVVAARAAITIAGQETVIIDIITGVADNKKDILHLVSKYRDRHLRDRAFELSWTHSQIVLRQINATENEAQMFGNLASSVIYSNSLLRASSQVLKSNQKGQSGLWSYSISGDLPIMLLRISDVANIQLVRQMIKAQAYLQLKGLNVDLLILNEDPTNYRQVLQDEVQGLIATVMPGTGRGKIFLRQADQIPAEDRTLFHTVARVIISDGQGSLQEQLNKKPLVKTPVASLNISRNQRRIEEKKVTVPELTFFNGNGGFSADGTEYVIISEEGMSTPMPWVNVIANKHFGTVISERGSAYTWAENAHSFRLTPWNNDPVTDSGGEAFYIRDEETGRFWSPSPWPAHGASGYVTRHGFGYTVFEHLEDGIRSEMWVYTDVEAAIKFNVIKLNNESGRARKISVTGYVEWVLGSQRPVSAMHIVTEFDLSFRALISRNSYNQEFLGRCAFFDTDEPVTYTTDRTEFIGRNGNLTSPEAMKRQHLSGKPGGIGDPCSSLQIQIELGEEEERDVVFRLGSAPNHHEALRSIVRFKGYEKAKTALNSVNSAWSERLGAVKITTPDPALNLLTNGWLLYQVLSSRLWGRSGFYQSGGAYGFRDQLQDVLATLHLDANIARDQILVSASRQFEEGDVQHWWHPPLGRGVRTLCSDDYLWLPFVTEQYLSSTKDFSILDEKVSFLNGRLLNPGEESYYDLPNVPFEGANLYEHCKKAVKHGMRMGEHGLPLIGSGDWNDGMNLVGIHGKGESVWLAFFLYKILLSFAPVSRFRKDEAFAAECEKAAEALKSSINATAWDGNWFKRAWFDDGTPLGSSDNKECRIDSISQSWSVLSEAADEERSTIAMNSADKYLVDRDKGLIKLLYPPFDKDPMDPGYIKGYVPGVRENGGQYTHAAIWMVMAWAKMGNRERTWELLKLINPVNHGRTAEEVNNYKVEPYVMAADVYGVEPHVGRGGWTWYTGSAGWMYQLILDSFLGMRKEGDTLSFKPCIPEDWESFHIEYKFRETVYSITCKQKLKGQNYKLTVDGEFINPAVLNLVNDKGTHEVIFSPGN